MFFVWYDIVLNWMPLTKACFLSQCFQKRPFALRNHFLTPISTWVRSKSHASNVPRASLHNELTSASARRGLRHLSVSCVSKPSSNLLRCSLDRNSSEEDLSMIERLCSREWMRLRRAAAGSTILRNVRVGSLVSDLNMNRITWQRCNYYF